MIIRPIETVHLFNPFYLHFLRFIFPGKSGGGLKSEEYDPAEPTEDKQVSVRNVQLPSLGASKLTVMFSCTIILDVKENSIAKSRYK